MSVMTRRPGQGGLSDLAPMTPGRPMPIDPAQLQRQAVMDQLGTQAPAAGPIASSPGQSSTAFNRGGQVKQLPGSGGQMAEQLTKTGLSVAGTAAGAFNPVTIGTNFAADKLKVKEEMPTFGGPNAEYLDDFGRRYEGTGGGIASNAVRYAGYGAMAGPIGAGIGAAAGAVKGAVTKNAPSAFTDFRVEDAAQAIRGIYRKELGREASDEEVMTHLKNQGFDPTGGDRWAGEKTTNFILNQIRDSDEAKQFDSGGGTRQAVMDQLAPGGPAGADPNARSMVGGQPVSGVNGPETAPGGPVSTGGGVAPDASGWNTDGYQAPAFATPVTGDPPPGISVDTDKWKDPNHQTPKYVWLRIAAANPGDKQKQVEELLRAYPGAQFNGKDKVTGIQGLGPIDIFRGASVGENAPQWHDINAAGGGGGGSASGAVPVTASAGDGVTEIKGGRAWNDEPMDGDLLARLQARLAEIMAGTPNREALMGQMGSING